MATPGGAAAVRGAKFLKPNPFGRYLKPHLGSCHPL
jgi:hypothetical protein